ncbi:hypothetical protein RB623_10645 [Mesorhizobium sp. LHD-90]|nr:hypothetical protein [Mesorhizobium sp. LHD-90]MDQ6434507.1 hypothetical protein [Mesorhizobium sp. LHD-90]
MVHPVTLLFEEIYRDHWGIPVERKERVRRTAKAPSWLRSRKRAVSKDG